MIRNVSGLVPRAIMLNEGEVPMVKIGPGVSLQLLQVDFERNMRVERVLLEPGLVLRKHTHTGYVHAWTLSGSWKYLEYPDVNVANSYLYEPAGSSHTLMVPAQNTKVADVMFIVHGSNIDLDENGSIHSVSDTAGLCDIYLRACKELGLPRPNVLGLPIDWSA